MADVEVLSNSFDYSALLNLAENFSDDGVINFNFLRTLLVSIVENLKRFDGMKKFCEKSSTVSNVSNKECQSAIESVESSSKCADMLHKTFQAQPLNVTAEAQTIELQSTAGYKKFPESPQNMQQNSENSLKIQSDHKINEVCIYTKLICDDDKTNIIEMPSKFNEKPIKRHFESLHDSSSQTIKLSTNQNANNNEINQNQLLEEFMNEVDMKFKSLDDKICGIVIASNGIVNEIERVQIALQRDSFEIKNVRYSLDQLERDFIECVSLENSQEMAAKRDFKVESVCAQVSGMKFRDQGEDPHVPLNRTTSTNTIKCKLIHRSQSMNKIQPTLVDCSHSPMHLDQQQQTAVSRSLSPISLNQQVSRSQSAMRISNEETSTQTSNTEMLIKAKATPKASSNELNFVSLHRSQSSMYMNIQENDENSYKIPKPTSSKSSLNSINGNQSSIELIRKHLTELQVKIDDTMDSCGLNCSLNSLESRGTKGNNYEAVDEVNNEGDTECHSIKIKLCETTNELLKCKNDIETISFELHHIKEQINLHQREFHDEMRGLKIDVETKLQKATENFCNDRKLLKEELKAVLKSQRISTEICETLKSKSDALKCQLNALSDAMPTKADYDVLHQKVSLDYFEATKRALTNSILELISQLSARENDWERSLGEMNRIIESKLNKDEISPLKEYLNKKVESIQDRLKSLNLLRRETEAAGTKYRLLKGVKCISCDSNATMKIIEAPTVPRREPFVRNKHLVSKLNEQMSIKAPKRASTVTMRPAIKSSEKRVKSSMDLTLLKFKEIEK